MKFDITLTMTTDSATQRQLDRIEAALETILKGMTSMALDLQRLETEITENNSVIGSAVTLINEIAQALRDAAGNQAAVNALADRLDAQSTALAEAVAANTPAETPTEPTA